MYETRVSGKMRRSCKQYEDLYALRMYEEVDDSKRKSLSLSRLLSSTNGMQSSKHLVVHFR